MSDQQPVYPPPAYAPQPPAYAPPPPGTGAPGQAPRKKTKAWVIALVVSALLLCCCVSSGGILFLVLAPTETDSTSGQYGSAEDTLEEELGNEDDPRLEEWREWDPVSPEMMDAAPFEKEDLVLEALAVVAPEFEFAEAAWYAGEYDAAEDWYYADGFYVRATHPSSRDISAAIEMWIQSDLMMAEDVDFEPEEGDVVVSVGERTMVHRQQWGSDGFQLADESEIALWKLLGQQWPDGVVTEMTGDPVAGYEIHVTKWHLYAVDDDFPAVSAFYRFEDGDWVLDSYEYDEVTGVSNSTT